MEKTKLKSITVNFADETVQIEGADSARKLTFTDPEAFSFLSKAWLRLGWDVKHVYSFSWLGRPIIQLPEDLLRLQEIVYRVKPDVILETGIAHGGSLIFYASLCEAMGKGRVIGVDVEIRAHNRKAIEAHELFPLITLIEGDSTSKSIIEQVSSLIKKDEKVLVILDSCHSKEHVLSELKAYSQFVSVGSYIVAMDGIMQEVVGGPRTKEDWSWNNPQQAALEFLQTNDQFVLAKPDFVFNEGSVKDWITYSPGGLLLRTKA